MEAQQFRVGDMKIVKVPELELHDFAATQLLPDIDFSTLKPEQLDPRTYEIKTDRVLLSVHTWMVHRNGKIILVDTGAGNGKSRPTMKMLDHLHGPYLARLAALGVQREAVDFVLLTHIHADHVGWNTMSEDDRWSLTFPNATVVYSEMEWRYGAALAAEDQEQVEKLRAEAGLGKPIRTPVAGVFADSIAPVDAKGRLMPIPVDGTEVIEGIQFWPTPGHSIQHAAISISSQGETAIFGGDVFHHPFEIYNPELVSMFCEFPEAARRSRRWLLEYVSKTKSLYFSSHFPASSAGRIIETDAGYKWQFEDEMSAP